MEKGYANFFTPTKPLDISFRLEESEYMEFQFSGLEKAMESMEDEFQK